MVDTLNQDVTRSPCLNDGCIQVQSDRRISIPSPDSDREMAIRCADWKRLEKRLTDLSDSPKSYSTLYGILFGLSGSAGLTLIPLGFTTDLAAWVLPLYGIFALGSLFCGIFTVYLSRDQRRTRQSMMTTLLDDVRDIGNRFPPTQAG